MSHSFTENQRKSLFRLLSDEDPSTILLVKQQLIDQGEVVVSQLESWLDEVSGSPAEEHLREVITKLKNTQCHTDFSDFCSRANTETEFDLEQASFLLASTEYVSTDMRPFREMLDGMASEIQLQLSKEGATSEIRAISHVLHDKYRFRGQSRSRYYEAENTYLNCVLERRVGIPLTLSLLYLMMGKRLGLPIHGVALPGHFIVTWHGQFFDPFNHGRLLNEKACQQMVEDRGQEFHPSHLSPATSRQVLVRMLMNLARVYEIEEDRQRLGRIRKYLTTLGAM